MTRRLAALSAMASLGLIACVSSGATGEASAQTQSRRDQIEAGRLIAVRFCGECHAVDRGAASPLPDAPPLPQLFRRFPVDRMAEALETGMLNDHPRMPEFKLEEDQRNALTAYLRSFQPRPARPIRRDDWKTAGL